MRRRWLLIVCAAATLSVIAAVVAATRVDGAKTVRVGVAVTYSGVGAALGTEVERGIELFIEQNPGAFGGHAVELVKADLKRPDGEAVPAALRALLDPGGGGVDILAGFVFSPNAIASAPLVTEARVPAVVMNASSAHIPLLSPYIARVSFSTWHAAFPMGRYAHDELGCNRGAIGYSDYSPGVDSGLAFSTGLEAAGGMLVADVPMGGPGEVPDFVPFLRRVIDADPDCLWVFVPAGAHNAALLEAYVETGMRSRGIKLLGPGALTQIARLQQIGDEAVGLMSMHHYSADYDTPANRAFVAAWRQAYGPDTTPGFMAVGGWDGMAAIAHAITAQDGNVTAEGTMEALAGWSFESPRGSITIDPETRDIIHDQHVHEVVPGNPRPTVKVVRTYPQVRDPCKALRVGECE